MKFYTHSLCPYAQRVALTLLETKSPHESVHIDLSNKPSWYVDKTNGRGLVPAIEFVEKNSNVTQLLTESLSIIKHLALSAANPDLLEQSDEAK